MMRVLLLLLAPVVLSCSPTERSETIKRVVSAWTSEATSHNSRLLQSAENFESSVEQFLTNTNQKNLDTLRTDWEDVHEDFLAVSIFFVGETNDLMYRIDAWPILEGFLDSMPDYPQSGIINDYTITIDAATLINQHGITAAEEVSLGFHALEYFVFAPQLVDFLALDPEISRIASRKRDAIRIITELLIMDINQLVELSSDRLAELGSDTESSRMLIESLGRKTADLSREAQQLFNDHNGHSRFSETSWSNLRIQAEALSHIMGEPIRVTGHLAHINQAQAANIAVTMAEALAITESDRPDSKEQDRLLFLLSALNGQIAHFID
ncbi:MAG: imelysin family protein [Pseudomonadales bacterium]